MPFLPRIEDDLNIDGVRYRFVGTPGDPATPFSRHGTHAAVFQVRGSDHSLRALKVLAPEHRVHRVAEGADGLFEFSALPGLRACARSVLTPQQHQALLDLYPDLHYAVLMPWIDGEPWQEVVQSRLPITPRQSRFLAQRLAAALSAMEHRQIAHCDLSGSNLLVTLSPVEVAMVDLEGLFAPGLGRPHALTRASPGYAHRPTKRGAWRHDADRFAGAVLLAEMLGWCDERIRESAHGESYFDPEEMHADTDRPRLLWQVLQERWGWTVADAFRRAWRSARLHECPPISEWNFMLAGRGIGPLPQPPAPGPLWASQPAPAEEELAEVSPSLASALDRVAGPMEETPALDEEGPALARDLAAQGRWVETIRACSETLLNSPGDVEVLALLERAQRMEALDTELARRSAAASEGGRAEDWKEVVGLARSAVEAAPEVGRYGELHARAKQALAVSLLAERAEALIEDGKLEAARKALAEIPPEHPLHLRGQSRLEEEAHRREEIALRLRDSREALRLEDWQRAGVAAHRGLALGGDPALFQRILERAEQEWKLDRQVEGWVNESADLARQFRWAEALERLDLALQKRPQRARLIQWREELLRQRAWSEAVSQSREALDSGEPERALAALADVPLGFAPARALRRAAQAQLDWQSGLQAARQAYDPQRVLELLQTPPAGSAEQESLRAWAEREAGRHRQLEAAKRDWQPESVLRLLADAPEEIPGRKEWQSWAEAELQRRRELQAAREAYNPEIVLRLLQDTDERYPEREEMQAWAQAERGRREDLEKALAQREWTVAEALLAAAPGNHPKLGEWRSLLDSERQRLVEWQDVRAQMEAALAAGRPDEAIEAGVRALNAGAPAAEMTPLLEQAHRRQAEEEQIRQTAARARRALQRGEVRAAAEGARKILALHPGSPEAQTLLAEIRAAPEIRQRIEQAQAAERAGNWKQALGQWQSLAELGLGDDHISERILQAGVRVSATRRQSVRRAALGVGLFLLVGMLLGGGWAVLTRTGSLGSLLALAPQPTTLTPTQTHAPSLTAAPTETRLGASTLAPAVATLAPTGTPTSTRTSSPTRTRTSTPTPLPTDTPVPTATRTSLPTSTPRPLPTRAPSPLPPLPTDTSVPPPPTNTATLPPPPPTQTPPPPDTPTLPPLNTPTWTPPPLP